MVKLLSALTFLSLSYNTLAGPLLAPMFGAGKTKLDQSDFSLSSSSPAFSEAYEEVSLEGNDNLIGVRLGWITDTFLSFGGHYLQTKSSRYNYTHKIERDSGAGTFNEGQFSAKTKDIGAFVGFRPIRYINVVFGYNFISKLRIAQLPFEYDLEGSSYYAELGFNIFGDTFINGFYTRGKVTDDSEVFPRKTYNNTDEKHHLTRKSFGVTLTIYLDLFNLTDQRYIDQEEDPGFE